MSPWIPVYTLDARYFVLNILTISNRGMSLYFPTSLYF